MYKETLAIRKSIDFRKSAIKEIKTSFPSQVRLGQVQGLIFQIDSRLLVSNEPECLLELSQVHPRPPSVKLA